MTSRCQLIYVYIYIKYILSYCHYHFLVAVSHPNRCQVAVRKQPNTKSEALRQLPQGEPLGAWENGPRLGNCLGVFWLLFIGQK